MMKLISSNRGMTLVEVLATLVIMSILSGIIYSVFVTGLKLYQKIGIEGHLRDDADYVATMILNEMYNSPPNYILPYENNDTGAKGIQMVRYKPKNVEGFIVEDSTEIEDNTLIYQENQKFFIEKLNEKNQSIEKTEIQTVRVKNTTVTDGVNSETSSISIGSCSLPDSSGKCRHGRISLNLVIEDSNQGPNSVIKTKPLILNSTFGF
ncbi:prepilin-type N-terminal cleavage/methylation domain-containing protein [Neobacillus novalis]|uniref:Prepilin-type N-terminal cleavage/methylation domain-containing protein n=1 Tax=Neobacillus novalis TaxID=220687 RepID=A0AA95MQK1_9BACI|nr:prepilin-type N-terminal cleavage/methylation domain-containing protein [Neobacillus novalis]WHY84888.1 prepilin-type N-terminal cleavage/methylation domain-containing protein [Neobacillus novalis]